MSTAVPDRSQRASKPSISQTSNPATAKVDGSPIAHTSCLLCGRNQLQVVRRIPTSRLIADWQSTFQIDIRSELSELDEIIRLRCDACDFDFFAPGDLTGSGSFYEALQRFDWYYMPNKWEHQVSLPLVEANHRVLEVGCAEGSFLQRVLGKQQTTAVGLELNQHAVQMAQQAGLDVRAQMIEDLARSSEAPFDFVCAFQVLEHVPHPLPFLKSCLEVTKPGGHVVLGVPNEDSFLQHEWTLLNMPPHHVSLWKGSTFERLASTLPISIESIQREPLASYHVDQYLAAYAGYYRNKSPLHRLLFSRTLRKIYRSALHAGWHRRLTGQSLLVVLRKDD